MAHRRTPKPNPDDRHDRTRVLLRHAFAILAVLLVAGCSGGGCGGGCSSCGGITPLTNGFDKTHRIENAGSVRLTQSGLDFLSQNLGAIAGPLVGGNGGVLTFDIPDTGWQGSFPAEYRLCAGGANPNSNPPKCVAEINIGNANLTIVPAGPHNLKITGTLPLRLRNATIDLKLFGISTSTSATLTGNNACSGTQTYDNVPLSVDISIEVDQNSQHARFGYSNVKILQILDQNQAEANIGDHLQFCGGIGGLLNVLKGLLIGFLYDGLIGQLTPQIQDQLCQKAPCPAGSMENGSGVCVDIADPNSCVSIMLGTDGHMDLGGLLASISPGTKGGLDFLFAVGGPSPRDDNSGHAWGDLNPVANGATLGMFGGAEPQPVSKCIKLSNLPMPTGIPIPTELFGNTIPNWPAGTPGPHVGIALSERFTNYAMNGVYNSGLLCIGISPEGLPGSVGDFLSSGTFGLLAASSKDLGLQREPQQVAIVIRPGGPPTVSFGNGTNTTDDSNIRVQLNKAAFDFYIFSLDRFVRFMTATFDLDVPVNLSVGPDGLTPQIDKIGVNNPKVTNNSLIKENPDTVATSLAGLLGGLVGQQLGGALSPIDLNGALSSLGLQLIIPDTVTGQGSPGLRKLSKGTDNYLGIFASLGLAAQPKIMASETSASLLEKKVTVEGVHLGTVRTDNLPVVRIAASSNLDNGASPVEYSYRVDKGPWHPYTRDRVIEVRDEILRLQGKHTVFIRSKVVGAPITTDPTPAEVEVTIDPEAPVVQLGKRIHEGKVMLRVKDLVSDEDHAMVRVKLDKGEFGDWKPASTVHTIEVGEAEGVTVEARDEEGNVASASQALIRGRETATSAGCGCVVAGGDSTPPWSLGVLGIAIAGAFARILRSRKEKNEKNAKREAVKAISTDNVASPRTKGLKTMATLGAVVMASSMWAGCNCGVESANQTTGTGSGSSSGGSNCPECLVLTPGLVGEYTSVGVSGDKIWLAGYAEANWDIGYSWGDLVVGQWDGTKVDWQPIDGVPTDPPPDPKVFDVTSFRGGQTEAGEDVGLWTSMAIDPQGNPAISYYDRTNKSLKFAHYDGTAWAIHTVEGKTGADVGRYSKIILANNAFVIAYQTIEPGGDNGQLISKVRVATSANTSPAANKDWTFEDAATNTTTPCRAQFCPSGQKCVAATKACTPTVNTCSPACASGEACIDQNGAGACAATFGSGKLDTYPDAIGDYVALAVDPQGGLGIAYYDRPQGALVVAYRASGMWTTLVADGTTGDTGIGASLFIDDAGDYHLTYVDGVSEGLKYVKVAKDKTVGAPEIIDDGLGIGATAFDDGQHLVGDDSNVVVIAGDIHVSYQDATSGKLRYAIGTPSNGAHSWAVKEIAQDSFAGAFSRVINAGGKLQLVNWWRKVALETRGDVTVLAP